MGFLTMEESTLQHLRTFSTVEQMNKMVKCHKELESLNKTDRAILDAISRYACKYVGVCYLSKQKIAEDAGFTSRRTAIRACHRLEELGVIKQYATKRITGDKRQSTNLIVIQCEKHENEATIKRTTTKASNSKRTHTSTRFHSSESQQKDTADRHSIEAFYKTCLKANTYKETYQETEPLLKRGLKCSIPEKIFHAFSPFFDYDALYEIYGILLRAKAKINPPFMLEDYEEQYIDHFYNVVRLYKKGNVRNLQGYLYVTWERLTAEISRQLKSSITVEFGHIRI